MDRGLIIGHDATSSGRILQTPDAAEQDVAAGRFRQDLLYRLNVFRVHVPSLRERREDIPVLAQHFLEKLASRTGKSVRGFSSDVVAALSTYDYPGNIRELENEVERAFTLADPDALVTGDLLSDKFADLQPSTPREGNGSLRSAVERFEAAFLREALTRNQGNQTRTAADLSISRRGLIDKLLKYGIR